MESFDSLQELLVSKRWALIVNNILLEVKISKFGGIKGKIDLNVKIFDIGVYTYKGTVSNSG